MEMAGPWITQHEEKIVLDALHNGWYGKNKYYYCELFEKEFAKYHSRKYALMTPNCTTATHLLLTALGITDNDEIIIPDCTWIATAAPVVYLRAKPIFCDIEYQNWCVDPESLLKNITNKTKAVIVVDLFGNMPLMDKIIQICKEKNILLIEDAAEALGSKYHNIPAGKFGIASVFSFHRTKTLTTGEGGMLLIDDDNLYERCKFLRDHGRHPTLPYYNTEVTYKYMPFNIQAALGYAQFTRLSELVNLKRKQFQQYKKELSSIDGLTFNTTPKGVYNSYWITTVIFDKKLNLNKHTIISKLAKIGIPSRPFFYPLSSLPAFNNNKYIYFNKYKNKNQNAYDISNRGINLPGAANLTKEDIHSVCEGIKSIL